MTKAYRDNGAIGALLDEYERSINDLIAVIQNVSEEDLIAIVDTKTQDEDCRSIQSILTHVVECGYVYAIEVRKWLGETIEFKPKVLLTSTEDYAKALRLMFQYNEQLFEDYPDISLEVFDPSLKFTVRWGQLFDVEQIVEHAIVHILRHRRQIERFKIRLGAE